MKKKILILGVVLTLVMALIIPASVAMAATTGTVDCTVSGKLISVSVLDGAVAYGTLAAGATEDTTTTGLGDVQTATNDGTVAEDFAIKSSSAAGATPWVLAAAAGADLFTHTASLDDGTTWTIAMTVPDTYSATALGTSVAVAGTVDFDLQIEMPTTITDYGAHTITVTILATES